MSSTRKKAPEISQELSMQRDQERQMVRGKFIFHECPGAEMSFVFRKYPGDALNKYSMVDGQIYTVPLAVARHLNKECSYPTYNFKSDEQGRPHTTIGEKVRRCSFQSLEFVDIDGMSNKIPSPLSK